MPELFPYAPVELREYLLTTTDVRETATGEYRDRLHDPLYRLEMSITVKHADAAKLEGLIRSNISGEWYIPLWQDATRMTSSISTSAFSIDVNMKADYRASPGRASIIQQREGSVLNSETVSINALNPTSIGLPFTPSRTYDIADGDLTVAPVVEARLIGGISRADDVSTSTFTLVFESTDPNDVAADVYPSHRTYDVWESEHILFQPLAGSISQVLEEIRNGFGHIDLFETEEYVRWRGTVSGFDEDHAARWDRRQFFQRCAGRDRPFWVPTWKNEFVRAALIGSAATSFSVEATTTDPSDLIGRSLMFRIDADTLIYREITDAVTSGENIDITIDSAIGVNVPVNAVVSLMMLCRFDTDELLVSHTANSGLGEAISHATFSLPVIEVLDT